MYGNRLFLFRLRIRNHCFLQKSYFFQAHVEICPPTISLEFFGIFSLENPWSSTEFFRAGKKFPGCKLWLPGLYVCLDPGAVEISEVEYGEGGVADTRGLPVQAIHHVAISVPADTRLLHTQTKPYQKQTEKNKPRPSTTWPFASQLIPDSCTPEPNHGEKNVDRLKTVPFPSCTRWPSASQLIPDCCTHKPNQTMIKFRHITNCPIQYHHEAISIPADSRPLHIQTKPYQIQTETRKPNPSNSWTSG